MLLAFCSSILHILETLELPKVLEALLETAGDHLKCAGLWARGWPAKSASSSLAVSYHNVVAKLRSVSMAPQWLGKRVTCWVVKLAARLQPLAA